MEIMYDKLRVSFVKKPLLLCVRKVSWEQESLSSSGLLRFFFVVESLSSFQLSRCLSVISLPLDFGAGPCSHRPTCKGRFFGVGNWEEWTLYSKGKFWFFPLTFEGFLDFLPVILCYINYSPELSSKFQFFSSTY